MNRRGLDSPKSNPGLRRRKQIARWGTPKIDYNSESGTPSRFRWPNVGTVSGPGVKADRMASKAAAGLLGKRKRFGV